MELNSTTVDSLREHTETEAEGSNLEGVDKGYGLELTISQCV